MSKVFISISGCPGRVCRNRIVTRMVSNKGIYEVILIHYDGAQSKPLPNLFILTFNIISYLLFQIFPIWYILFRQVFFFPCSCKQWPQEGALKWRKLQMVSEIHSSLLWDSPSLSFSFRLLYGNIGQPNKNNLNNCFTTEVAYKYSTF